MNFWFTYFMLLEFRKLKCSSNTPCNAFPQIARSVTGISPFRHRCFTVPSPLFHRSITVVCPFPARCLPVPRPLFARCLPVPSPYLARFRHVRKIMLNKKGSQRLPLKVM